MNAVKYLAPALLLAAFAGCASYPISKDLRQQAQVVTMDQVKADPAGTRGRIVIWGGRIINVANDTNGSAIYIVCLPMGSDEKPVADGPSPGRFIATTTDFLDPEAFPAHRRITVAGQLDGVWTEPLGKIQYTYPVLDIKEAHVWPVEPPEYPPYGYYGPDWFVGGVFIGAGPWFHGPRGFWGHVDNRWDPRHGYRGPLPVRGAQPFSNFHANEARDGRGHTGMAGHSGAGEHSAGFAGHGHAGGRR